jgi:hypothetical protein
MVRRRRQPGIKNDMRPLPAVILGHFMSNLFNLFSNQPHFYRGFEIKTKIFPAAARKFLVAACPFKT